MKSQNSKKLMLMLLMATVTTFGFAQSLPFAVYKPITGNSQSKSKQNSQFYQTPNGWDNIVPSYEDSKKTGTVSIVKAFYQNRINNRWCSLSVKVKTTDSHVIIIAYKDPNLLSWQETTCFCKEIPNTSALAKEFNYTTYHQIFGNIYF